MKVASEARASLATRTRSTMMNATVRSSATQRLLAILLDARRKHGGRQMRAVWADILCIPPDDHAAVLQGAAQLINLVASAKAEVGELADVNTTLYAAPFERLETALTRVSLEASANEFISYLDDRTMLALEFCADQADRQVGRPTIPMAALDELLGEVEALQRELFAVECPTELRSFVTVQLEAIRIAILRYRIGGMEGLDVTLKAVVGALVVEGPSLRSAMETTTGKSIGERFTSLVGHFAKLLSVAKDAKEVLGPLVAGLLGPEASNSVA